MAGRADYRTGCTDWDVPKQAVILGMHESSLAHAAAGTGFTLLSVALRVGALLVAVMLSLAGCNSSHVGAPNPNSSHVGTPNPVGPCEIVPNGTPVPKTAPTPTGAPPSSRNVGTNPEIATSYRSNMT